MLKELLSSLNIEPLVLALNGILFLILLVAMDRLFWKPVMAHLARRKATIAAAYEAVDRGRSEMEALKGEYEARLARIEGDARSRIQQTVREAQARREDALTRARREAAAIADTGAAQIVEEHTSAVVSMHGQLDDIALLVLSKATDAPTSGHQRDLVDRYIVENVMPSQLGTGG